MTGYPVTFLSIRNEKKQETVQQLCHVCWSVYQSTCDDSNSEQMFMKFHAGCFKSPQYIPIVDKFHKINWVLFTGGMRLGSEAGNLPINMTRMSGVIPLPFHTSLRTDT